MIASTCIGPARFAGQRGWMIATAALFAFVGASDSLAVTPSGPAWEVHVNNNDLTTVDIFGDTVWFGSQAGGVIEFDTLTGTFNSYTQSVHCLPSNTIEDISIGTSGDVWVATPRGVALRPAGAGPNDAWIPFNGNNSPLPNSDFLAVEADPTGGVWIGTFAEGAFFFDGATWTQFTPLNGPMQDDLVTSIVIDDTGAKWFGHFVNSVDRFDGVVWTNFIASNTGTPPGLCDPDLPPAALGIISNFVRVLGQNPFDGGLWIDNIDDASGCHHNGTSLFDGLNWSTYTPLNSNIFFRTEDIAGDPAGFTWLVSLNGLQQFDDGVITTINSNGAPDSARGVVVDSNSNGSTWFATPNGIFELNGGVFTQYPPLGLNRNSINDLAFRMVGSNAVEAWVVHANGVQRYDGTSWNLLTPDNSPLMDFSHSAVAVDLENAIWIGSSRSGSRVYRMLDGVWQQFDTANSGLISTAISDIAVDPITGAVWFGDRFSSGLAVYDGSSWETFRSDGAPFSCINSNGVPGRSVTDIEVDDSGIVWIGSLCGFTRYDGEILEHFTTEDGLADNNVRDIDIASDGSVWIGTFHGVSRYRNGVFDTWLPNMDVRTVTSTADGVWISMFNVGVAFFDGIDWIRFGIADGLVNNRVFFATGTHPLTDQPWFGTEGGIAIVADIGLPADIDQDGDVDGDDFASLIPCLAGPQAFFPPIGCTQAQFEAADIHGDGDVDLGDAASLLLQLQTP